MNPSEEIKEDKTDLQASPKSGASTEDKFEGIYKLFQDVMKNKWDEVVKTYKNSPKARVAKLVQKSEDTALHIAVSNDQAERAALELVKSMDKDELKGLQNAKGNTPLHLAVVVGNLKICEKLVSKNSELIAVRNKEGETPIFIAALLGREDIFFYLQQESEIKKEYLRRDNGDTILHVAISGEYFSMAMTIIDKHPKLVDAMNVDGLSPLHVLANKPTAFRSSTQFGSFDRFIYYCLYVDNVMITKEHGAISDKNKIDKYKKQNGGVEDNRDIGNFPKNYETFMNFYNFLLKKLFRAIIIPICNKHDDEENPQENNRHTESGYGAETPYSSPSVVSDQQKENAQAKDQKKIENTTGKKNYSRQKSCFKQYCEEEVEEMDKNRRKLYPPNYESLVLFFKLVMKVLLTILGVGIWRINEIQRKKKLHMWAKLVMEKLVESTSFYKTYGNTGLTPDRRYIETGTIMAEYFSLNMLEGHKAWEDPKEAAELESEKRSRTAQTPILIAAKHGVKEMVEKILEEYPVAIHDEDAEQKNVALLAIENRQPHVYKFLLKKENIPTDSVFRHVDYRGNSAMHLAATQCEEYRPWLISGSSLQMQWEIKWFQFVKNSMPPNYFSPYNKRNQTPNEVFVDAHKDLINDGSKWLTKTSQSYSVVAALVSGAAFSTATTAPGGVKQDTGRPTLEHKSVFTLLIISSLIALFSSVTALVFFLSILVSPHHFDMNFPWKLILGFTSLFLAIASMLVTFVSANTFELSPEFQPVAYLLYVAFSVPLAYLAVAQLSVYLDLIWAI